MIWSLAIFRAYGRSQIFTEYKDLKAEFIIGYKNMQMPAKSFVQTTKLHVFVSQGKKAAFLDDSKGLNLTLLPRAALLECVDVVRMHFDIDDLGISSQLKADVEDMANYTAETRDTNVAGMAITKVCCIRQRAVRLRVIPTAKPICIVRVWSFQRAHARPLTRIRCKGIHTLG
jgi:hypothetical protein